MAGEAHLTLDSGDLRSRLRSDYSGLSNIKRPTHPVQPPTVSSDYTLKPSPDIALERDNHVHAEFPMPSPAYQAAEPNESLAIATAPLYQPDFVPVDTTKRRSYKISFDFKRAWVKAKSNKLQYSLSVLAVLMVISGLYLSYTGWHNNHIAKVQAARLTAEANRAAAAGSSNSQALSTLRPTQSDIHNYAVAPNLPRYLTIPKLGVYARIFSVGLTSTGALGTPHNVYDTDWYDESSQPGQPGAMLIDGHVSSWTAHGVFYGIKKLVPGDTIKVIRGDGVIFTYKVVRSIVYPSGNVDMKSAIAPVVAGTPGLNLITCTGDVIPGTNLFNERIVVYAEQVNP